VPQAIKSKHTKKERKKERKKKEKKKKRKIIIDKPNHSRSHIGPL